jgi:EAL domain-containing protein (putative c-di-GMP-specific phosphodiesterase class I)
MTDTDTTHHVERLHALGVRLAVDDFGTVTVAATSHLRPSEVKIDRAVRDLSEDESDRVLVKAIGIAHTLEISVVAEGVETTEQRDFLRRIGCNVLQGYLISRPQPAAAFERLVVNLADAESQSSEAITWAA